MDEKTIRTGLCELSQELEGRPVDGIRQSGSGRPSVEKKEPQIEDVLASLVEAETAGDPMSETKWLRSSLRHLSDKLRQFGHVVSPPTVSRLLKKNKYSLKVNRKEKDSRSQSPQRNAQFEYISLQKKMCTAGKVPLISVDSKKKELIGDFKNGGVSWCQSESQCS